jgi:hypothetical protein
MARLKQIITDFTTGEISPRMISRTDLESYKHGAKEMVNAYPLPHGAATGRRGTQYVAELRNSTKKSRLIPFIYSRTLSYVLVLNDGKLRLARNGAYILNGGSPYEINIPYGEDELTGIRYTQVGSIMYLVHGNYPPKILTRIDETNWTLTDATFTYKAVTDYWYENHFIKFKIISGTTAFKKGDSFTITVTGGVAGAPVDVAPTNVGNGTIAAISSQNGGPNEVWTILCDYNDATRQEWTVTGSVSGTKVLTWHTGIYPKTITFHEQRLYFGGTANKGQTIWGSTTGEYSNFTQGAKDNDALQFTIASNQYDELIHLSSARYMLPLTYGGEFSMTGSTTTGITPSTIRIAPQTYHGSNDCMPIKIGNEILFVQRDGAKVRAISYSVAEDVNQAPDISVLAEHLVSEGVTEATFAQSPDYISWWIREDGTLLSCVHMRDFNMTGWSSHTTDGLYEHVASIPESNQDTVYLVVKRTINGVTKRYIEFFNYYEDIFTDAAITLTSVEKTNTWTGLSHLEGKEVYPVGDGEVLRKEVVDGGSITTSKAVNKLVVGIPYEPYMILQHPNIQNEHGTSQGGLVSISKILVKLQNTVGLSINGRDIPFRKFGDTTDTPLVPFTGDKEVNNLGWSANEYMELRQPYPLPWTVLSVMMFVNSND